MENVNGGGAAGSGFGRYSSKRCANLPRSEVNTCFLCFRNDSISEGVKCGLTGAGFGASGGVCVALVVRLAVCSFSAGISRPLLGGRAPHLSSLHCNAFASSRGAVSTA